MRYFRNGLIFLVVFTGVCVKAADDADSPPPSWNEPLKKDIEDLRKKIEAFAALKAENEKLRKQLADSEGTAKPSALKQGNVLSVIAIKTSQEDAAAFVKAFTDSPKASHKMKGFLGLAVAENAKEPGSFLVISSWENEDALNAYVKSPEFVQDHEKSMSIKSAKTEKPARYVVKED